MTRERDIQRVLDHWFAERPTEVPDRVLDEVADRIGRQPQQPAWLTLWRDRHVNTYLKYVAAVAAVVLVAAIGFAVLRPSTGTNVGGSSVPTPSPAPSPSPPAITTPRPLPDGTLAAGTYRLRPFSSMPTLSIDVDVPGGWQSSGFPGLLAPGGTQTPSGLGIALMRVDGLFADACRWDQAGNGDWEQPGVAAGTTVDDLVAALRANASYTSSDPVPITIGGYSGKRVDLQLPADLDVTTCDKVTGSVGVPAQTQGNFFVFTGHEAGLYAQGPANRWQVSIIDVRGNRVVIVVTDYAGTSSADRAAAQSILDSFVITP